MNPKQFVKEIKKISEGKNKEYIEMLNELPKERRMKIISNAKRCVKSKKTLYQYLRHFYLGKEYDRYEDIFEAFKIKIERDKQSILNNPNEKK